MNILKKLSFSTAGFLILSGVMPLRNASAFISNNGNGYTVTQDLPSTGDYSYLSNRLKNEFHFTQNQINLTIAIAKADAKTFEFEYFSDKFKPLPTPEQAAYAATFNQINADLGDGFLPIAESQKNFQTFLNQLSPGLYTALPTILFNSANVQNTEIQQRLWATRTGTEIEDNSSVINGQGDGDKNVVQGDKKVVVPAAEPEQKWTTFVDGNGMWSQAQSVNNLPSYNTYAGGIQAGASYELFQGLNVGPYVGYQGTKVNFTGANGGGSSATDNSVRFGLFGEFTKGGWYTDGIVGGAYNSVAVNHGISLSGFSKSFDSTANGTVSGGEFDSLLGTGYDFKAGKFTFGPTTSLQYTYLHLGGTQETGAGILDQNIGSQNASSLLYTLGGQAHYDVSLTQSVKLQPFLSLAWQHEFLQNGYNVTSSILGESYNYGTTNPGRDQYIAGIGGNLVLTKNLSAYAVCNLINGDNKVFSQAVSGGINLKF